MQRRGPFFFTTLTVSAGLLCGSAIYVLAQDGQGGLNATLDVTQSLRASDNPEFEVGDTASSLRSVTTLGVGLSSQTRSQNFSLNFGGSLEADSEADNSFDAVDPFAALNYGYETRQQIFSFGANYTESDVNRSVPLLSDTNFVTEDLILDSGTEIQTRYDFSYEIGREAPLGFSLDLSQIDREFEGTTDTDLLNSVRQNASASLRFDLSRVTTVTLTGRYADVEAEGTQTDRTTHGVDASLATALRDGLNATARISYDSVDVTDFIGNTPDVRSEEGPGLGLGLEREVTNGTYTFSFDSDVGENGRRSTSRVGRSLQLPTGELSASAGVTKTEGFSANPVFGLNYLHALPSGSLSVDFSQSASADADSDETLNSQLQVSYDQRINALSSWSVALTLLDSAAQATTGEDTRRIDLNASYSHEITRGWNMVGGYTYSSQDNDGGDDRSSNTVFLNLEKRFSFRP